MLLEKKFDKKGELELKMEIGDTSDGDVGVEVAGVVPVFSKGYPRDADSAPPLQVLYYLSNPRESFICNNSYPFARITTVSKPLLRLLSCSINHYCIHKWYSQTRV